MTDQLEIDPQSISIVKKRRVSTWDFFSHKEQEKGIALNQWHCAQSVPLEFPRLNKCQSLVDYKFCNSKRPARHRS